MRLTRRGLLIGAGATGGLLVAWALTPRSFAPPLAPAEGEFALNAWLKIGTDGVVTVAVPQLEMGQGITTLLPQIVATELGADWRQVAVEMAPVSGAYANVPLAAGWAPLWMPVFTGLADAPDSMLARRFAESEGFMVTADGTSLAAYETPARNAAAAARAMLAMAAADQWGVSWEECAAQGGFVLHGKRRLAFAELVTAAAEYDPPDPPVLRPDAARERPGENPAGAAPRFPRLDLPAKVDGSYLFAGDVRLPDMVFASIRHGPIGDARLGSYDPKAVAGVQGFLGLVKHQRWLAAVAQDWWAAERALGQIAPRFTASNKASSDAIARKLDRALAKGDATVLAETGDAADLFAGKADYAVRYDVAPALHATLETASATARISGDRCELWVASQAPEALRRAVAGALNISLADVVLYPMPAGGSFDRRLEHDHAVEAALIARAIGKPVQLMWSRWQEHLAGLPRTPVAAALSARTAQDGTVSAWKARLALPATTQEFGQRLFAAAPAQEALSAQDQYDPLALDGCIPPYAMDHVLVEHVPTLIPLSTGRMRGNSHGYGCFFTESFIDELAHRAKREPLSFRMALLGQDVKLAECLQRAASLASWGGGVDGSGQGLACHRMQTAGREGRIAVIASARRDETGIKVDRLTAIANLGRIVNVDIARQQVEGALLFGMGLAIGCSTAYADGLPLTGRLGLLGLPLLADCPEIEVDFVESDAPPFDPGELGVAAVAPAIANALFSATGLRLRKLPLLSEDV